MKFRSKEKTNSSKKLTTWIIALSLLLFTVFSGSSFDLENGIGLNAAKADVNQAPVITNISVSPLDGSLTPGLPVTAISVTGTDPDGDNISYEYGLDTGLANTGDEVPAIFQNFPNFLGTIPSGGSTNSTTVLNSLGFGILSWGTHTVYVRATDSFGWTHITSKTFTLSKSSQPMFFGPQTGNSTVYKGDIFENTLKISYSSGSAPSEIFFEATVRTPDNYPSWSTSGINIDFSPASCTPTPLDASCSVSMLMSASAGTHISSATEIIDGVETTVLAPYEVDLRAVDAGGNILKEHIGHNLYIADQYSGGDPDRGRGTLVVTSNISDPDAHFILVPNDGSSNIGPSNIFGQLGSGQNGGGNYEWRQTNVVASRSYLMSQNIFVGSISQANQSCPAVDGYTVAAPSGGGYLSNGGTVTFNCQYTEEAGTIEILSNKLVNGIQVLGPTSASVNIVDGNPVSISARASTSETYSVACPDVAGSDVRSVILTLGSVDPGDLLSFGYVTGLLSPGGTLQFMCQYTEKPGTVRLTSNQDMGAASANIVGPGGFTATAQVTQPNETITVAYLSAESGGYTATCPNISGYALDVPSPTGTLSSGGELLLNCLYSSINPAGNINIAINGAPASGGFVLYKDGLAVGNGSNSIVYSEQPTGYYYLTCNYLAGYTIIASTTNSVPGAGAVYHAYGQLLDNDTLGFTCDYEANQLGTVYVAVVDDTGSLPSNPGYRVDRPAGSSPASYFGNTDQAFVDQPFGDYTISCGAAPDGYSVMSLVQNQQGVGEPQLGDTGTLNALGQTVVLICFYQLESFSPSIVHVEMMKPAGMTGGGYILTRPAGSSPATYSGSDTNTYVDEPLGSYSISCASAPSGYTLLGSYVGVVDPVLGSTVTLVNQGDVIGLACVYEESLPGGTIEVIINKPAEMVGGGFTLTYNDSVPAMSQTDSGSQVYTGLSIGNYSLTCNTAPSGYSLISPATDSGVLNDGGTLIFNCDYDIAVGIVQVNVTKPAGMTGGSFTLTYIPLSVSESASTTTTYPDSPIGEYSLACADAPAGYVLLGSSVTDNQSIALEGETITFSCEYGANIAGSVAVSINANGMTGGGFTLTRPLGSSPSEYSSAIARTYSGEPQGLYSITCYDPADGYMISPSSNVSAKSITDAGQTISFSCNYDLIQVGNVSVAINNLNGASGVGFTLTRPGNLAPATSTSSETYSGQPFGQYSVACNSAPSGYTLDVVPVSGVDTISQVGETISFACNYSLAQLGTVVVNVVVPGDDYDAINGEGFLLSRPNNLTTEEGTVTRIFTNQPLGNYAITCNDAPVGYNVVVEPASGVGSLNSVGGTLEFTCSYTSTVTGTIIATITGLAGGDIGEFTLIRPDSSSVSSINNETYGNQSYGTYDFVCSSVTGYSVAISAGDGFNLSANNNILRLGCVYSSGGGGGGTQKLTVKIYPGTLPVANFRVVIPGSSAPVPQTVTSSGIDNSSQPLVIVYDQTPVGEYRFGFEDALYSGYLAPKPQMNPDGSYGGIKKAVIAGQNAELIVSYIPLQAGLKEIPMSETEMLHFTPTASVALPQWYLVKGESAISEDGQHWQYNAAEVLMIDSVPADITLTKTNNTSIIPVTGEIGYTEYDLSFRARGIQAGFSGTIVDSITVSPASESNKVRVVGVSTENPATTSYSTVGNTITFNVITGVPNFTYNFKVRLSIDGDIAPGTKITNTATANVGGSIETAIDEDVVAASFIRETVGGSVFGRRGVNLRDPSSVLYIIGSGGEINAVSDQDWVVGDYGARSKSVSSFGIDEGCEEGSGCSVMQGNIDRLMLGAEESNISTLNSPINLNPRRVPEGGVLYYPNGLTIGPGGVPLTMRGRGTIIVDGDLHIDASLTYDDANKDIAGFIVRNGNVIVGTNVTEIDGIFYIYSDNGSRTGSFISQSRSPGYDDQLIIKGAIIASGYLQDPSSPNKIRKDAFVLSRNYIGPQSEWGLSIIPEDPSTWEPSEQFEYDPRIILTPPPGFTKEIFKARD